MKWRSSFRAKVIADTMQKITSSGSACVSDLDCGSDNEVDEASSSADLLESEKLSDVDDGDIVHSELNLNSDYISSSDETVSGNSETDEEYVPSQDGETTETSCDEKERDPKIRIRNERTLLVYESKLSELLCYCPKCGSSVDRSTIKEVKNTGSQLHLKITCYNHCDVDWKSQPTVGSLKGLGNLFLATSIAFSGLPYAKVNRFAWLINLKFISDSVYYQLRRDFIFPVVRKRWSYERKQMIKLLQSRDLIILVGDGRCDSPGHSAKYCTYTFIETATSKVVDTIIIPVTEVKNSNAMEKEGFIRLLNNLQKEGLKIDIISTDKHTQIRKLMRVDPTFKNIKHQFDPWHIAKGICKKLNKAAKKNALKSLLEWVPSIVNHFWWSVSTCNKDPQLLYEKFSSVIYHTVNKHEWGGYKKFKKCEHPPLTKEEAAQKKWLVEGSEAHQYLASLLKNKNTKNDMKYLTEAIHTTNVEVFNNLLLKYIPKQYHFEYDHMIMGAYLTALDNNFNCQRRQAKVNSGENVGKYRYKIAWRKPSHKFIARKIYTKKSYDYLKIMMSSVYKRAQKGGRRKSQKRIMAPSDHEDREVIIERAKKMARFAK